MAELELINDNSLVEVDGGELITAICAIGFVCIAGTVWLADHADEIADGIQKGYERWYPAKK